MAATLIVSQPQDEPNENPITESSWLAFVQTDPDLEADSAPITAKALAGGTVSISASPGQSKFRLRKGKLIPFLRFTAGQLTMKYHRSLNNPDDPVRQKLAAVAAHFGAEIATDAGDDALNWRAE